jgi:hypothetical protein
VGARNFSIHYASRTALGPTQPPIQWVPGALPVGVKWPECEADTQLNLVPRLRMRGGIFLLPQYAFMAWCSVNISTRTTLFFLPFMYKQCEI